MSSSFINIPGDSWQTPVPSVSSLPTAGNNLGDARVAQDTSTIYIWTGSAWSAVSGGGSLPTPVSVANGGTNSSTALANGQVMVSNGGKIVEASADTSTNMALVLGTNPTTDGNGVELTLTPGTGNGAGSGGNLQLNSGPAGASGSGGNIFWTAASSVGTGASGEFDGGGSDGSGGTASIIAGNGASNFPGDLHVTAGDRSGSAGEGGYLYLSSGNKTGAADTGHVQISTGGTLVFDFKNGSCYFGNYHVEPSQSTATASSSSTSLDLSGASGFILTLAASTTVSFINPQTGGAYALEIVQGASAYAVSWQAGVLWPGGTKPTITTANGAKDKVSLYYDGTNYFGTYAQAFS